MTLRSSMIALVVLLVALGAVFALTSDTGVQTHVFLPNPTETPTPTLQPTMTPLPAGSADNWEQATETTYQYTGEAEGDGTISVDRMNLAQFIEVAGLDAPADDDPYPLMALQEQLRSILEDGAQQLNLQLAPFGITGPSIELIGDMPVTMLHVRAIPQTMADGTEYEGQEMVFAWTQSGEDIVRADLNFKGAPSETIYNDYRAWLEENMPKLAAPPEEDDGENAADATPEADATEAAPTAQPTEPVATEAAPTAQPTEAAPTVQATATEQATETVTPTEQATAQATATEQATEEATPTE